MGRASSLSTKKRLRQSKRSQMRNKANKTRLRSQLKKIRTGGKAEDKAVSETYSIIDKSVKKGVLHKNAAARLKSRLNKNQ